MSWRPQLRHVLSVAVLGFLIFYQNCASTDNSALDSLQSYEQNLPFAYQATPDTIAYMSCSNITDNSYDQRAYFSLRVGAYTPGTSGLQMTTAFYNATASYQQTNRAEALATAQYNSGATMSLSIRSEANYQIPFEIGSTVAAGVTVDKMLPELDTAQIAGPLVSTQGLLNYFPGNETQRLMEGSLRIMDLESDANTMRNYLSSDTSILVVGYTSSDALDTSLRSPLDLTGPVSGIPTQPTYTSSQNNTNMVFGTGYKLQFSYPVGYTSGDKRVLSTNGILEKNMVTGNVTQTSNWTCSSNYQFMVVRPEDIAANLVTCGRNVDRPATTAQADALNKIRRVLRVEDWWVDLDYHCVVPKQSGDYCYGDPTYIGTRQIQYGNTACVDSGATVSPGTLCPHFVSVCVRNAGAVSP